MIKPKFPFPDEENLKIENEVLKMKLMLETGARFFSPPDAPSPDPLTEHEFLRNVMDYEDACAHKPRITVFDRIGKPAGLRKVHEIPGICLEPELEKMMTLLHKHGIHLSVLSPNVPQTEIYRFITEELMQKEMVDFGSPGIFCFVYDDYHPDPCYDNQCMAVDFCISQILRKKENTFLVPVSGFLDFNEYRGMSAGSFTEYINRFKNRYKDITNLKVEVIHSGIDGDLCRVNGIHETGLCLEEQCLLSRGHWEVDFRRNEDELWEIIRIRIDGIRF